MKIQDLGGVLLLCAATALPLACGKEDGDDDDGAGSSSSDSGESSDGSGGAGSGSGNSSDGSSDGSGEAPECESPGDCDNVVCDCPDGPVNYRGCTQGSCDDEDACAFVCEGDSGGSSGG